VRAADEGLAEGIAQKRPVNMRYGTWHGTRGRQRHELSVPLKRIYRLMKEAFSRVRTALKEQSMVDV